MQFIKIDPNFNSWRDTARSLLLDSIPPNEIAWTTTDDAEEGNTEELFSDCESTLTLKPSTTPLKVPQAFLKLAEAVSYHSSNEQWSLLYDVLYRITHGGDKALLYNQTDPAIKKIDQLRSAIRRDIHKMRAFVRFREVNTKEMNHELYIAWFEPEHKIVRVNASFFRKRFGGMHFSILTPHECVHWDMKQLTFTDGVSKSHAPDSDALEKLWLTYYKNIFNPARLKIKAMQSEMPKKYWKNLPEAEVIEQLIKSSTDETNSMLETEERPVLPAPKNDYLQHLRELNEQDEVT